MAGMGMGLQLLLGVEREPIDVLPPGSATIRPRTVEAGWAAPS